MISNTQWYSYKYKLTVEQYDEMMRVQDGRCAICGRVFNRDLLPQIDHDHETEKVRGFLCLNCNCMLGFARDKVRVLAAGIVYLEDHGKSWAD